MLTLTAQAHPLAPALLELREIHTAQYDVLWRTSVTRTQGAEVQPVLPSGCVATTSLQTSSEENQSLATRWQIACGQGLAGQTIAVTGLDRSRINVILRIEPSHGEVIATLLDAGQSRFTVPQPQMSRPVFGSYLMLGIEHLLFGFDHVLFVLGLLLLIRRLKTLVITITAFTLGHSLTLALATLGFIRVSQALTEIGIALSILFLAYEIVRPRPASLFRRYPWFIACAFGLLHGLGFAGALADVGLPAGEIPLSLLAFNLGIEAGQLAVVAVLLCIAQLGKWGQREFIASKFHSDAAFRASPAALATAYLIGSLAAYWCIERSIILIG